LRLCRPINVTLVLPGHPVIAQRLTPRTTKNVLDGVILELVAREASMRLVTPINHRNVRLDVPLPQPGQEFSAAVGLIRSEALGADTEPLFYLCEHPAGG
jgi:hypothetical protein